MTFETAQFFGMSSYNEYFSINLKYGPYAFQNRVRDHFTTFYGIFRAWNVSLKNSTFSWLRGQSRKIGQNPIFSLIFKKSRFHQFSWYDHMVQAGWKHSPWSCFGANIMCLNIILKIPPGLLSHACNFPLFFGFFKLWSKFPHV